MPLHGARRCVDAAGDEDEVALDEGMPVTNQEGEDLGTLGGLLIEEEEEEAEFILLRTGEKERLVPFEAILGVGDGSLVLDVPAANVDRFPLVREGSDPSNAEMEQAYRVFDEGASEDSDDEA